MGTLQREGYDIQRSIGQSYPSREVPGPDQNQQTEESAREGTTDTTRGTL